MKNNKIQIPNPCTENWDKMKIGLKSRFCDNCQKNVIDFTIMSREEILEYLLKNYKKNICGHIYRSQLDFSNTDFLITINSLSRQHKNTNLSFYLLTLGTLILSSCDTTLSTKGDSILPLDTLTTIQQTTDTSAQTSVCTSKDSINIKNGNNDVIEIGDLVLDGEVALFTDTIAPYTYVDIMPEFYGGVDSLTLYITNNLNYPNWERDKKIQGIVYVTFIVDQNGEIRDTKILRSVEGSSNFDSEVLRMVNNMPTWKPGQKNGENVDVQFNLPIRFKL